MFLELPSFGIVLLALYEQYKIFFNDEMESLLADG